MNEADHTPVIAVDGGGTRCRLAHDDGNAVVVVETGSANVSSDFDGAVAQVIAGLDLLADRTGVAPDVLGAMPAFIGLAGVTGRIIANRLAEALPLTALQVADDRPAALRGVLGGADGVLAHCGTGSFFAIQSGGEMRFVGGWGPRLGDEASAQWIGRKALRAALDQADLRCAPTPMTRQFLADLGGVCGIVGFAGRAAPAEFGALAPTVTRHAREGDPQARRIMQAGADEIAATLREVGWKPGLPVCLTGGIGPHFADYLPADLRAAIARPMGTPLDGALALARAFAQGTAQ